MNYLRAQYVGPVDNSILLRRNSSWHLAFFYVVPRDKKTGNILRHEKVAVTLQQLESAE